MKQFFEDTMAYMNWQEMKVAGEYIILWTKDISKNKKFLLTIH